MRRYTSHSTHKISEECEKFNNNGGFVVVAEKQNGEMFVRSYETKSGFVIAGVGKAFLTKKAALDYRNRLVKNDRRIKEALIFVLK